MPFQLRLNQLSWGFRQLLDGAQGVSLPILLYGAAHTEKTALFTWCDWANKKRPTMADKMNKSTEQEGKKKKGGTLAILSKRATPSSLHMVGLLGNKMTLRLSYRWNCGKVDLNISTFVCDVSFCLTHWFCRNSYDFRKTVGKTEIQGRNKRNRKWI